MKAEQELLTAHDVIILHHPLYWYSAPSLVKEWLDPVPEHGWAYGEGGAALRGKHLLQAVTCGGSAEVYCSSGRMVRERVAALETLFRADPVHPGGLGDHAWDRVPHQRGNPGREHG